MASFKLKGTQLKSFKLVEEEIEVPVEVSPDQLTEDVPRPETLIGKTYKIKPDFGPAMYITINDIVLNEGTDHEEVRPFEIFIKSKNVEHDQWTSALTRVMSAVFRKGGDVTFLTEELQEVFDPRGGYWHGSQLMGSIVAHIGLVLKEHLESIGMLKKVGLSEDQKALVAEKLALYTSKNADEAPSDAKFPSTASVCKKCRVKAVIRMDNCDTCLNCSDSGCG